MGSYGRNFDFREMPRGGQRNGRFYVPGPTGGRDGLNLTPIGVPGVADTVESGDGLLAVTIATGAQTPNAALSGIIVYEYSGPEDRAYMDPWLMGYSDSDTVFRKDSFVYLARGQETKVVFTNTVPRLFLHERHYDGRTMVASLGSISVGDYLTPGAGSDSLGYWAKTSTPSEAWLMVTAVTSTECEARMMF